MPVPSPPLAEPEARGRDAFAPLASPAHTAVLVALIVAVALTGTLLTRAGSTLVAPAPAVSRTTLYLQMTAVAWGLLFYVCRVGRSRSALGALVGHPWTDARRAFADIGLAAAGWLALEACEIAWVSLFARTANASTAAMLPTSVAERVAWVAVSLSVGLSEEVTYRGYLQTQLAAFTRRPRVASLLQALLFGLAHAEQGPAAMVRFAVYGLALGALARARQSLIPGILCHVATNVGSGLLGA